LHHRAGGSGSTFQDWGWDRGWWRVARSGAAVGGVASSQAVVRIADDRGRRIGTYVDKYQGYVPPADGDHRRLCASACTIILGAVSTTRFAYRRHSQLPRLGFRTSKRAITNAKPQMLSRVSDAGAALRS
jgi:hypothetical protein